MPGEFPLLLKWSKRKSKRCNFGTVSKTEFKKSILFSFDNKYYLFSFIKLISKNTVMLNIIFQE